MLSFLCIISCRHRADHSLVKPLHHRGSFSGSFPHSLALCVVILYLSMLDSTELVHEATRNDVRNGRENLGIWYAMGELGRRSFDPMPSDTMNGSACKTNSYPVFGCLTCSRYDNRRPR